VSTAPIIELLVVCAPILWLAGMWLTLLLWSPSPTSRNVKVFIVARNAELLLSLILLGLAWTTRTPYPLVGLAILYLTMSAVQRTLRRRELGT
jgi:hypothetical protein